MINCYQPFRTSLEQATTFDKLCKKFNVNKGWLLRYLCNLGLDVCVAGDLRAAAKADPLSVPKIRKKKKRGVK